MATPAMKMPVAPAQLNPLSLLRMVWLHRLAILLIWLVVSAVSAIIVRSLPAVYKAEVSILVDPQKIPNTVVQSMVTTNVQDRLATISQQILSTAQLQKVIDDFGLYKAEKKDLIAEEIVQLMRTNIKVSLDKGWTNNTPGAFRIAYTGEDPAVVAQVANRLGNLFIEENMRTRETQVEGTSEFLETQLQDAKKRLDEAESAISQYKLKHNGELPEQTNVIASTLNRMQAEQNANRDAIARAEQSKKVLEDTLGLAETNLQELIDRSNEPVAPPTPALTANKGPAVVAQPQRVLKRSEALEIELAAALSKYSEQHPDVKRLRRDIAMAKAAEEKVADLTVQAPLPPLPPAPAEATSTPAATASAAPKTPDPIPAATSKPARERPEIIQARERIRTMKTQVEQNDKDIVNRQEEQERIQKAIVSEQGKLASVPVREQEIALIMRDHAALSAEYQSLLNKSAQAKISTDMELRQKSERFAINDPAHVPGKPSSPDRVVLNLMGSIIGLGLGLLVALGREFHRNRLLGAWELPEEAPVLIHVPRIMPIDGGVVGLWAGWRWSRRLAVLSAVVIPILGLLIAAGIYLRRG